MQELTKQQTNIVSGGDLSGSLGEWIQNEWMKRLIRELTSSGGGGSSSNGGGGAPEPTPGNYPGEGLPPK